MLRYDNATCNKFVKDMEKAGRKVEHYRGRNYWEGPAVRIGDYSEEQDVIRETKVRLQSDQMGKTGMIIYPVAVGGKPKENPAG